MHAWAGLITLLVVVALFLSGIAYYVTLYQFACSVRARSAATWATAKQATSRPETMFATAYRLLATKRTGPSSMLDAQSQALAQRAKVWLYIALSLFTLVLVAGLWISLAK